MTMTSIDEARLEAFMGQAVTDMGAIISAPLFVIGEKLGLYKAMAGAGPLTSQQVAERAGAAERYSRLISAHRSHADHTLLLARSLDQARVRDQPDDPPTQLSARWPSLQPAHIDEYSSGAHPTTNAGERRAAGPLNPGLTTTRPSQDRRTQIHQPIIQAYHRAHVAALSR
ncbi:MAG TPA: hypothetical protein VEF89_25355 [Solirubrobacteraceae bacterium]|nr:hypothetical protein [Solirubrobacteraceae bacterium]